jgi:hypothetical protein
MVVATQRPDQVKEGFTVRLTQNSVISKTNKDAVPNVLRHLTASSTSWTEVVNCTFSALPQVRVAQTNVPLVWLWTTRAPGIPPGLELVQSTLARTKISVDFRSK